MMNDGSDKKPNETIESVKTYFKGVKAEWGRISWPERQQIIAETISVLIIVAALTIMIYLLDLLFKGLLSLIH